ILSVWRRESWIDRLRAVPYGALWTKIEVRIAQPLVESAFPSERQRLDKECLDRGPNHHPERNDERASHQCAQDVRQRVLRSERWSEQKREQQPYPHDKSEHDRSHTQLKKRFTLERSDRGSRVLISIFAITRKSRLDPLRSLLLHFLCRQI